MKAKKSIIIFISFFIIVILFIQIDHYFNLKKDYQLKVNFIVEKKVERDNGTCYLYTKNDTEFPLQSFLFYKSQIYERDSVVKKSDSYLIYVYRKRNWKDYGIDKTYFVAEKIQLDKK
ncbi:hypothetical protein [Flavobacterium sp.]|uniref:hypothetical protein n=1 Tax=Flavobacterium sp. TaxID=239 RepID=UPI00286DC6FD|nr:hypothetical protein [Flavobacterium sp.]